MQDPTDAPHARYARVDATDALRAPADAAARTASHFLATVRRLPTMFRTPMVAHALSPRLAAPAPLRHLVSRLSGRLTVVNPVGAARLPPTLALAVRAVLRAALDPSADADASPAASPFVRDATRLASLPSSADARGARERRLADTLRRALPRAMRDRLADGVRWGALALYEGETPAVHVDGARDTSEPTPLRPGAILRYRLALVLGDEAPPDAATIDAAAARAAPCAWPPDGAAESSPWFAGRLLVPDAWLAMHADAPTLARWASATGRAGARDGYWYPETWERFLERGRSVGCVSPADVWQGRRSRTVVAEAPSDAPWAAHAAPALTPDVERGICVPPGYALVDILGALSVSVAIV